MQNLLKGNVKNAFSKAADSYEELSDFHKQIAWRLLNKIKDIKKADMVLDVGMGTGFFTEKLPWFLNLSKVIGIDFSMEMINRARRIRHNIDVIQADASMLPFKDNSFDLIVSNLSYQWVDDLKYAFIEANRVMKRDSKLFVTMFGYNTFKELFISLENCVSQRLKGNSLPIKRLANHHQIMLALKNAGFVDIEIKCEQIKIRFDDLFSILKWSKGIGANALKKNMYIGKDLLARANIYYMRNFSDNKSVYTTFEIVWIEAEKGHK